jgi:hypothetical protein
MGGGFLMTPANMFVLWILGMFIYVLAYTLNQVLLGNPGGKSR